MLLVLEPYFARCRAKEVYLNQRAGFITTPIWDCGSWNNPTWGGHHWPLNHFVYSSSRMSRPTPH